MHVLIDYKAKCALSGLNFQYYSHEEVSKLSVKEVTNPQALDRLSNSIANGLYDLALGPLEKNDICLTCNLDYYKCPGHFGHINLCLPVYNPIFFKDLIKILRSTCLSCHQLVTTKLEKEYFNAQMAIIKEGLIEKLPIVDDLYAKLLNKTDNKLLNRMSFRVEFDELVDFIKKGNVLLNENTLKKKKHPECVRNVVRAKLECLKRFIENKIKPKQICPNCSMPLRQLRAEHNAKLFYAKGVSNRALKKKDNKLNISNDFNPENEVVVDFSYSSNDEIIDRLDVLDIQSENENEIDNVEAQNLTTEKNSENGTKTEIKCEKNVTLTGQAYLTPIETRKHLQQLIENEREIMMHLLGRVKGVNDHIDESELFFFDSIAIPPSKYRPISQFKDQKFENPQTAQLSKLLSHNIALNEVLNEIIHGIKVTSTETVLELIDQASDLAKKNKPSLQEKLQAAWLQVQGAVNVIYDSDLDKLDVNSSPSGLKQLLEKKEGLFRKHMMGKRVNYAGRSVISPDAYIDTDEIGVPQIFAKKLTYPQPVNSVNFWELKQLVLNGPDIYPGACLVEYGNGNIVRLQGKNYESRLAIAKQLLTPESSNDNSLDIKIVHRHLKNGDVLLFNRQPTLHRPSVMGHKARVLQNEKTLRMHYSNCKAYNADFDGDEMNAHLPQNEIARSEALNLLLSPQHYLVPKDGTPLGGLIHDHVVSGVALTMRGRFFNKSDYQMLVYNSFSSLNRQIILLPPTIIKPEMMWTGKQVISTLLLNLLPNEKPALNLEGKSKISQKIWYNENDRRVPNWKNFIKGQDRSFSSDHMNESFVLIRNGHLLSGVLDKAHYGSSSFSLVHCVYELYGGHVAGQLLSCLGRVFTAFIQLRGFTLGVEDILLKHEMQKPMDKIMKKAKNCGYEILAQVFTSKSVDNKQELLESYQRTHMNPDESFMKEIDLAYKGSVDKFQNSLTNVCFPSGLIKKFPYNNLQLMIQSGAKGSSVNSMQMSCLLGQQELEGKRPRLMPNGNTLPSFLPYDPSPNSGGFISNSFMTGLTPQEYFFHCMAGREGLVDTAVKTSRSGYLQRCLVKHLEGITVSYDMTVRDSDNSIIQFQYGEDSLAVEKTPFINEKQFPFLIDNYPIITANKSELEKILHICKHHSINKKIEKTKEWFSKNKFRKKESRSGPFYNFSKIMSEQDVVQGMPFKERIAYIGEKWKELNKEEKKVYKKGKFKNRLPITCAHNPDRYLGAISENLQECIDNYITKYSDKFLEPETNYHSKISTLNYDLNIDEFKELIYVKSLKSCISPGDSVGVIAAQSIGEPSTQMTLNTFHFAGRGDMNVTLGIPRLREILMVASSNIKTPSMQVPIFDDQIVEGENLKEHFTRTLLWDCFHNVDIEQTLKLENSGIKKRLWLTKVKFKFLPQDEIKQRTNTNIKLYELLYYIENKFIKNMCISINKKYNQISSSSLLHSSKIRDTNSKNFSNINGIENENEDEDDVIDKDEANDVLESGEASELLNKIDDELEYVGENEEQEQLNQNESSSSDEENDISNELYDVSDDEMNKIKLAKKFQEEKSQLKNIQKKSREIDPLRVARVINISEMIEDYKYDTKKFQSFEIILKLDAMKPRLDLYSVIQKEAKVSYVAKVQGIKRCFLNKSTLPEDKGCYKLITEGINVYEIIKNSNIVDISKLYMNDIHCMAESFGIEAAVKVLINEISMVFKAYGINVDYRHLSLIADYMTFEGIYKPFNRIGIKASASPLQKMSFETCLQFFKDAVLTGQHENFDSPSSRIVVGRMIKSGTGCFDLLTQLV